MEIDSVAHNHHSGDHHHHLSPYSRLNLILKEDRKDLVILVLYTTMAGLMALAVPLAAQALVNTIAAGVFIQPLVVLTTVVFVGLIFSGILRLLKLHIAEVLQQRIFARFSLQLANHIVRIKQPALQEEYAPELINRFFDVINVQKSLAKILLDGPSALLTILVGLVLMAFYSPILLAFNFFLIFFVFFVVFILGIGGLRTSIQESIQKYRVAEWLEELGRCQISFKMNAFPNYLIKRADNLVVNYIKARKRHFSVIFRQAAGNFLFNAVASAGILAVGGWLVINRQLTLGQLVASELIIITVLSSLDKLIKLLEVVYDLLTGIDKIGHVTDLPTERIDGKYISKDKPGARVICRNVHFSYIETTPVLSDLNLKIEPGERVSLVGASGVGKSTLASLLCGLNEPMVGTVEINNIDVRDINLTSLRHMVNLVGDTRDVFDGTIEENIVVGRPDIGHEDIKWALDITQLSNDIAQFPKGLKTQLVSEGRNISRGQVQRLLIARAIVDRPQLLILDEAFTGIDEKTKLKILNEIYSSENGWTIIDISHDLEVVMRSDNVHLMAKGKILESGSPKELSRDQNTEFIKLFPSLLQPAA
ncbi:MAG: ATP-binding cassette domain-containing protein [Blastocatellia bacterium]|nr:ATP-binding cassette domain-containing protein [Blastocatellia bacterium]